MRAQLFCLSVVCLLKLGYGLDVIVVAGGSMRFDTKILSSSDPTSDEYDCSAGLPDLPHPIKSGVGFANKDGKPMVCGGKTDANHYNQQCYVYDKGSNSWVNGPITLKKSRKAKAVGLPDGRTWIIGGTKLDGTEIYNPATDMFEEGPDVPISFMLSPCAVRTPRDTILILGKHYKTTDNNKLFEYSPADGMFNELTEMPGSAAGMICGSDDSFTAVGELFLTGDAYVYSVADDAWTTFSDFFDDDERFLGSASLQIGTDATIAIDGVNPASQAIFQNKKEGNENISYNGYIFACNVRRPFLFPNPWAQYTFPPTTDDEPQRNFPVAMWVDADMVCQST